MQVTNGTGPAVRRSKRPLLAAAPIAMFYGNLRNLVIRSKSVTKSSLVISKQIGVMSDHLRVSLYMVMSQNVVLHLGEGDFIMSDEICS